MRPFELTFWTSLSRASCPLAISVSIRRLRSAAGDHRSIRISAVPDVPVPMLLMLTANAVMRTGSAIPGSAGACASGRAAMPPARMVAAAATVTVSLPWRSLLFVP